jgi:hypothetical protein
MFNKNKLKLIWMFFLQRPKKYLVISILLRLWLLFGLLFILVLVSNNYIEDVTPPYSELTCTGGSLVKIGQKRLGKKTMDYMQLKITDNKSELFFGGIYYHDIDFLQSLIGEPMTVCFHGAYNQFTSFNQYVEIIYQNKRTMNNYETRRLHRIAVIERSKSNFWQTFFWWVLFPLTLTILILKKYKA